MVCRQEIKKNQSGFQSNCQNSFDSGFTLLEVIIVLVIMATLSILSSQSIQQSIRAKVKLQGQIDDVSQMRDSLKVMERDINLAFHYTDMETELKELTKKKRLLLSQQNKNSTTTTQPGASGDITTDTTQTTLQGPPPYNPNDPNDPLNKKPLNRVDPTTDFIGKENEIYFATLNSSQLNEDIAQADFIKVAYLLQSCKKPGDKTESSSCLIRRSSNVVEGDLTKGGDDVVLLENVSEFKLRYFGKGKQDWVNSWSSKENDGATKGKFPEAVEISLSIEKPAAKGETKKKSISMQIVVPIRFPNNTYQDNLNNPANNQNGQPGQQIPQKSNNLFSPGR